MKKPGFALVVAVALATAVASCTRATDTETRADGGVGGGREEAEPPSCPACGAGESVVPIVYGKPGRELLDRAERGEVKLGGCVTIDSPRWHCKKCGGDFNR